MSSPPTEVVMHPTVLLSAVDHYNRVAKDTKKRVVGVLLGAKGVDGQVDVTNSFALPFEEEEKEARRQRRRERADGMGAAAAPPAAPGGAAPPDSALPPSLSHGASSYMSSCAATRMPARSGR